MTSTSQIASASLDGHECEETIGGLVTTTKAEDRLTVRLTDARAELLALEARKLGVTPEDLLRAAVVDLIEGRDEAFLSAARHVIEKNAELYQRLS